MPRPEDEAINRAQDIIKEDQESETEKSIPVEVEFETVNILRGIFKTDILIFKALQNVTGVTDRKGRFHPESMDSILASRFQEIVEKNKDKPKNEKVTVDINGREIDFINKKLLSLAKDQLLDSKDAQIDDSDYKEWVTNLNLEMYKDAMGSFRDLNQSFIQSGGQPQEAYLKIFGNTNEELV